MKVLLFLFCALNLFSQSKRFVYKYEFIPDSNNPKVTKEYMFLDLNQEKSQFYSYKNYNVDSTALEYSRKGLFYMPPNQEYLNFRIEKDFNTGKIDMISKISSVVYRISDDHVYNWTITNNKDNILGHPVVSAEINFGGRHWTAWFAPDIPFQDGPYKFHGLPGLILKIEDDSKSHRFVAVQIKTLENYEQYPLTGNSKPTIQISQEKYKKMYLDYRLDPLKDLRGRYPDQRYSDGSFVPGDQAFRNEEKRFKERIKKDNNIIEIDLLK